MVIKKGEIVDIEVVDDKEIKPEEKTEKAANPPTIEMVLARLDQIDSKINENSEALKALKEVPKKDEKDKDKEEKKAEEKVVETPKEEIVEKKEEKVDVIALITKLVEKEVSEKIGDQPIQKRSTAIPEKPKTFETPMDIPAEVMLKGDPESILKMGGYTMKRRGR